MSKYIELLNNPPKLTIVKNPKEVIFKIVSCMCDNVNYIRFKKNQEGEFKLDCMGHYYGNFSIKTPQHELEWKADESQWRYIIACINEGISVIESVQSR